MTAKVSLRSAAGKALLAAIERGDYDEDLRALRNLFNRRMRDLQNTAGEGAPRAYNIGDRVEYHLLRGYETWHPKYFEGMELEIISDPLQYESLYDGYKRQFVHYDCTIVRFKREPRGAFGNPPRYEVGKNVRLPVALIRPLDTDAIRAEHAAIQRRLKGA